MNEFSAPFNEHTETCPVCKGISSKDCYLCSGEGEIPLQEYYDWLDDEKADRKIDEHDDNQ